MPAASSPRARPNRSSPTPRSSPPTLETLMLEVAYLSHFYGKHQALADLHLRIGRSEIVAILGANGAGKSTLLKAIAGLVTPAAGAVIRFAGTDLNEQPAHLIVERGIALVPEGRGVFGDLTVAENLQLGAYPAS